MGSDVTSIPQSLTTYYTTYAAFPTTGLKTGSLAYATDTLRLYRWNGAAWQAITPDPALSSKASSGTYSGNDTENRAIPHGLGVIPKIVLITVITNEVMTYRILGGQAFLTCIRASGAQTQTAQTAPDSTNFYVGNSGGYNITANDGTPANTYYWVAIG